VLHRYYRPPDSEDERIADGVEDYLMEQEEIEWEQREREEMEELRRQQILEESQSASEREQVLLFQNGYSQTPSRISNRLTKTQK
jgi:hypothetical protein